jgi:hypothetical protein
VLKEAPQEPRALYGRSLISAMRGDMSASRKHRIAALDLDPKVADWTADTYRMPITQDLRSR